MMLYLHLLSHGGEIPESTIVIYCNTGKEREETLEFVKNIGERWGVQIVWLEFEYRSESKGGTRDPKYHYRITDFENAARCGKPFDELIIAKDAVPSVRNRFCTQELKVETITRYLRRGLNVDPAYIVRTLGIRYDEPDRFARIMSRQELIDMPLYRAKVTKREVDEFWEQQNFDLGIPSNQSNCDECFLKPKGVVVNDLRVEPQRADWWIDKERYVTRRRKERGKESHTQRLLHSFRYDHTMEEMVELASQGTIFDVLPEEERIDCICGD